MLFSMLLLFALLFTVVTVICWRVVVVVCCANFDVHAVVDFFFYCSLALRC